MKLNMGCGPHYLAGWTNVDADTTVKADVHADALEFLDRLGESEVEEIYAGHFLEHLAKPAADRFLRECYRVLVPGGVCAIVVPDMREVLKRYIAQAIDEIPFDGRMWRLSDLDDVCGGSCMAASTQVAICGVTTSSRYGGLCGKRDSWT